MHRKLALIDIDNTLNLFDATCVIVAQNLFGIKVPEEFASWSEALNCLSDDQRMEVFRTAHSKKYIDFLAPIGGSVRAVQEIAKDFDVVYVSDRRTSAHDDTVAWLKAHDFPNPENLVCSSDKREYMREISDNLAFIIDDRPRTMVFARYELGLPHVFSIRYRYNENLSDIEGVHISPTWLGILANYREHILLPSISNV